MNLEINSTRKLNQWRRKSDKIQGSNRIWINFTSFFFVKCINTSDIYSCGNSAAITSSESLLILVPIIVADIVEVVQILKAYSSLWQLRVLIWIIIWIRIIKKKLVYFSYNHVQWQNIIYSFHLYRPISTIY